MSTDNNQQNEGPYQKARSIAAQIKEKTKYSNITIGIVCGSGLGAIADQFANCDYIDYGSIQGLPQSTVIGHKGRFVIGTYQSKQVICMQGRLHPYEGHSISDCVLPIRAMKLLGVHTLILTNAAGGVNKEFKLGNLMIINDHIFMAGFSLGGSPLWGPNDTTFGERFVPLSDLYNKQLREIARIVVSEMGIEDEVHEGSYAMVGGPHFESPAEIRLLRTVGADAIGMSTAHEAIAGRHCGMRIFGMSMITNVGVDEIDNDQDGLHNEIVKLAQTKTPIVCQILLTLIERMSI